MVRRRPRPMITQASTSSGPTTSSNVTKMVNPAKKRRVRIRKQRLQQNMPENGKIAILICNLPPHLRTNDIENIIQQTTGLNRLNSPFYIELRKTPCMVEALIKFLIPSHSMMSYHELLSSGYEVIAQSELTLNSINNRFNQRFMQHMVAISAHQSHPQYYNKIANKMGIPNNSINAMSRHVQNESATGFFSNANTQAHFPMNVSNIMDNPTTTSLPNSAKETIEQLHQTRRINYTVNTETPDCHTDNGFKHMAAINAHETFPQILKKDDFSKNVTTENISNNNLQKLSTNNDGNVTVGTMNQIKNYLQKAIEEELTSINNAIDDSDVVKHKQTDIHDNDDDSNDSTSTFVLKEEPIDFNELTALHQESSNGDKTVDAKDYIIIKVHNIDAIKQEPKEINNDKISEDENNLAINELLDNFNPNIIEIKEEPVETSNAEVLPETVDLIKQKPNEINNDKISEDVNNLAINEPLDNLNPNEIEIKEEPVETNNLEVLPEIVDLIKQEPNEINNDKISEDENNLEINKLLDNFNPNEMEIKEEPVNTNNPEVLPETNIVVKDMEKAKDTSKNSLYSNSVPESSKTDNLPKLTDRLPEITRKKVEGSKGKIKSKSTNHTHQVNDYTTSDKQEKECKTTKQLENAMILESIESDSDYSGTDSETPDDTPASSGKMNQKASLCQSQRSLSWPQLLKELIDVTKLHHSKAVHVKNWPQHITSYGTILNIILRLFPEEATIDEENIKIYVLYDSDGCQGLGEILLKLSTHQEAKQVCKAVNGANLKTNVLQATLGLKKVTWNGDCKIIQKMPYTAAGERKRKRPSVRLRKRRPEPEIEHDAPAEPPKRRRRHHHRDKNVEHQNIENPISTRECQQNIGSSVSSKNASIPNNKKEDQLLLEYGFRSEFLQSLGLKTPLTNTIDVNQLHECVDKEKLYEVFSLAGDVKRIQINCEKRSAKIEFDHPIEAVQAIFMFRKQTLFEKEICIEMDYRPKALPVGLSGMNKGFNKYGKPLRGVRTNMELRDVHEILYEMGKMVKVGSPYQFPFGAVYVKRDNTKSTRPDSPTISSTTVSVTNTTTNDTLTENGEVSCYIDLSSSEDSNEKSDQADDNTQVIEQLGAVLKSRGIIPIDFNCKDAKSILDAIKSNPVHRNEKKNVDNNSENTIQTASNVLPNSSNGTQSAPNTTSNAFNVPPLFLPQPGHSQLASMNQNGNKNVDNNSQNMPTYALPNVAYGTQYLTQGIPNAMSFTAPAPPPLYEPQSGPAVPPNVPQTGYVVPPNVPQSGYTVPLNVPQSGYVVQPNVPQSVHVVPPNVPQSGHVVPPNVPQSGYAVPPNVPQSVHAVPPNVPQSGYTVPLNVPQSGCVVQPNVPQSGYAVQPIVPQSGYTVQPNVPLSGHIVPPNVPQSAHATIPTFVPPPVSAVPPSVSAVPSNVPPSGRNVPQFESPTGQAVSKPDHGSEQGNKIVQQNVKSRDPRLRSRVVGDSPKTRQEDRSSSGVDKGIEMNPKKSIGCSRLIFRNLPPGVSEAELSEKMREVGDLLYCERPTKNGLAFVAFNSLQDAERCLRLFHRAKVDGQVIDVIAVS